MLVICLRIYLLTDVKILVSRLDLYAIVPPDLYNVLQGHDEMLANTLDQLLAVAPGAYHNIIVHCSDGTINTNK